MMSMTQVADSLVVELWAQPNRTAGLGGLIVALSASGTVAQMNTPNGWVLPFGLAMLGQPPTRDLPPGQFVASPYEIVAYTMNGNNLMGMVRGLGGTNALAWPTGTLVTELNCVWNGMRSAQLYIPGQSAYTLRIPSSWVPLIHLYMLSRYRRIEQQEDEASKLNQAFEAGIKEATKKKPIG